MTLRRHPLPMEAHFRNSLVLAYAFPRERLQPLLPPGLVLDVHAEHAFAAVAVVQTERLRPRGFPFGLGFVLCGFRIFVRVEARESLRGLYVLRSATDSRTMALAGNALTHYRWRHEPISVREHDGRLEVESPTLHIVAHFGPSGLPPQSPFASLDDARRFAGPLPYTFDVDDGRILAVRGVRSAWNPQPVAIESARVDEPPFPDGTLANAFHVANVDYRWERGRFL
jgi:Uncharacterized conserved protein (COG2071)